jgi:hypothetical protein
MHLIRKPWNAIAVALLAGLLVAGVAGQAAAQKKAKSVQTEATFVKFDAEANTVTVKVKKPGRKVKVKEAMLKRGKEASFDVKPEGSILVRTSVAINGKKGELADIPEGKTVNIYWVVDETKGTKRFARKIDMILSDEELDAMYGTEN